MFKFKVVTRQGSFEVEATCSIAAELEIEDQGLGVAIDVIPLGVGHV